MSNDMSRVLIVDDDVDVCETLRRILGHVGIDNRISVTAASASAEADKYDPHAAIIDFVLPDTDGITLTQSIRSRHPDIKVVMISGVLELEAEVGQLARAAGVNTLVQKPFRASEIIDALGL